MKKLIFLLLMQMGCACIYAQTGPQVKIINGMLEGVTEKSGVRSFKGIPYAQPPIGELRWKEPQPVNNWGGTRKCDVFGYSPMQKKVFGDMVFRSPGVSEDCLYLNVWTPAKSASAKLPVLVYFYGGGFVAGDGSEYRYDGESLSRRGIVTVTINYRLGVFGFMAHPELTKESPHHSSGNYGLMDINAALRWVQQNIAAFGGDPKRVTIAGESAGSMAVSAQMVSPLSKNLIAGAIGESGAVIKPTGSPITLSEGESRGVKFGENIGAATLAALRMLPANELLDDAYKPNTPQFAVTIDGYFLVKKPVETLEAGEQAHVPLLVGWNSAEVPYQALLANPTPENYAEKIRSLYGENAVEALKLYPGSTQEEAIRSATALASDRFIVYSTWKWADAHAQTSGKPVYRYVFSHPRPPEINKAANTSDNKAPALVGAAHASEIEYALGNLPTNPVYAWTADDYKVSDLMETYFANFIKTGNPNGTGLPRWTANTKGSPVKFMNIKVKTILEDEKDRERYLFLQKQYQK